MPISFKISSHGAVPVEAPYMSPRNANDFLGRVLGPPSPAKEILQTSLGVSGVNEFADIRAEQNGFVSTIVNAYINHHHLVIRPDDVWIAMLAQLTFYVNAHPEELRSMFVHDEGKLALTVQDDGNRYTLDFGELVEQMTKEVGKRLVDKDLRSWILPNFSTTTHTDTVACAILMLGTFKSYFSYRLRGGCGIPTMTFEGWEADWERLLSRIDKLESFGNEPRAWAAMLRPILRRIVSAFDGNPDRDFFSRICHHHAGSPETYLSGWITAFCVWDSSGKWQGPALSGPQQRVWPSGDPTPVPIFLADGVLYPPIHFHHVPRAYCEVDVELDDNGTEFDCQVVSGHMGSVVVGQNKDTLRPLPAWFMFVKEQGDGATTAIWTGSR